jgi:hypothetical protein
MSENITDPVPVNFKTSLNPGTVTDPTIKFSNSETTGIYSDSDKEISFSSDGSKICSINKDKVQLNKPLLISNADGSFTGSSSNVYLYRKSGDLYYNNGTETKIGGGGGSSGGKCLLPVKYVTNLYSNPATAAPNTADSNNLDVGDRVLVIGSSPARYNGIYVVSSVGTGGDGVWDRASDYNTTSEISLGDQVTVLNGLYNKGKTYYVSNVPLELDNPSNNSPTGYITFMQLPIREYTETYTTDIGGAWGRSAVGFGLARVGPMCSLNLFGYTGTASSSNFLNFISAIPADFRPSFTQYFIIPGIDNGVSTTCTLILYNDGTISIAASPDPSVPFTNGGLCGFRTTTISWSVA